MRGWIVMMVLLAGCPKASTALPKPPVATSPTAPALAFPPHVAGALEVLEPTSSDYPRANLDSALKPPGEGGVAEGVVVRLAEDLPVYRLWNGPERVDDRGNTNRLGGWWAFDAPTGTQADYREHYEVCLAWNDLTWVATCTLKAGAVVAIGPGQSVSAETCGDVTGQEHYPASPSYWQVYVDRAWTRQPAELECGPDSEDYAANPEELSRAVGE